MRFAVCAFAGALLAGLFSAVPARAAAPCQAAYQALQRAETVLDDADAASAKHDTAAAKTQYADAIAQIQALPWTLENKACDSRRYTFQKLAVLEHSLVVAVDAGLMNAIEARGHESVMWQGVNTIAPGLMFSSGNRDLQSAVSQYGKEIADKWRAAEIAVHAPAGAGCTPSNAGPIALQPATPPLPHSLRAGATLQVSILVTLSSDGTPLKTSLQTASGDPDFDRAAVLAARATKYLPEIRGCVRVPSTYVFHVEAQ